jgi:hypothetical protein
MSETSFALVNLRWLDVVPPLQLPRTQAFGTTGFREADGPGGLFSIYVVLLDERPTPERDQQAKVFVLLPQMEERLPKIGERFIITVGIAPVAEAVAVGRGRGSPENAFSPRY